MKILLALLVMVATATAGETNAPPQLVINLTDGSRIIGIAELPALVVRSETLGRIEIPLARVREVKFDANHESATVTLGNGDRMQGAIGVATVALQTSVGRVTIPLNVVSDMMVTTAPTDAGLREGLVAYYLFNGDAKDSSGNENHGKVVGAEFVADGIQFRGDGATYVVVPRSNSLEPADEITVTMWLKGVLGQEAGHGWATVLRKMAHCQPGYGIRGGGISSFIIGDKNPCAGGRTTSVSFRRFNETHWQHIAATYSRADGSVKSYQDGELLNEASLTKPLFHSGDLYLGGAVVAGDDGGFRGLMREVRIYNRALSAAEIKMLQTSKPTDR